MADSNSELQVWINMKGAAIKKLTFICEVLSSNFQVQANPSTKTRSITPPEAEIKVQKRWGLIHCYVN